MTSIRDTTSAQYFQPAQSSGKADAAKPAATAPAPKEATEYNSTKNSDGTYGPKHTKQPPSASYDSTVVADISALDIFA